MALSGNLTTTASHNRSLKLSWTATQNNAANTSTVTWALKGSGSASGYIKVHAVKVTIDSKVVYNTSDANCNCYSGTVVASGTVTMSHKTDGTKSFTVKIEAGIYNYSVNCSGNATFTLNTIILGSAISSVSNVILGNNCQIKWTPISANYAYKIKLVLNNWSYTTGTILPNSTNEYTYNGYVIPIEGVAQQIPNSKTGTMTAYLYTYADGKQIGSASSKTFSVTVPATTRPILTNVTATIDNSANSVVQNWGVAVAKYTKVQIHAEASGTYGAVINNFSFTGGYSKTIMRSSPLNYLGETINSSGNKSFTVKAIDSRGYSSSEQTAVFQNIGDSITSIYFYPYAEPNITAFVAQRIYSSSSGGRTKISINADWTYSTVGNNNVVSAILYYKKTSEDTWTTYGNINANKGINFQIENPQNSNAGFSELEAYNFKLVVKDSLNNSSASLMLIPTAEVLLDFKQGGRGIGVGKIAEADRLEIGMEIALLGIATILDNGTEKSLESYIYELISSASTPQILRQPTNQITALGGTFTVSISARGVGLTYQWYLKKYDESEFSLWAGRNSNSETVTSDETWNGALLYCDVVGSSGNITRSNTITVTLN